MVSSAIVKGFERRFRPTCSVQNDFASKWSQSHMPVAPKALSFETELCDGAGGNPNIAPRAVLL
jgi:hypothetical protein